MRGQIAGLLVICLTSVVAFNCSDDASGGARSSQAPRCFGVDTTLETRDIDRDGAARLARAAGVILPTAPPTYEPHTAVELDDGHARGLLLYYRSSRTDASARLKLTPTVSCDQAGDEPVAQVNGVEVRDDSAGSLLGHVATIELESTFVEIGVSWRGDSAPDEDTRLSVMREWIEALKRTPI